VDLDSTPPLCKLKKTVLLSEEKGRNVEEYSFTELQLIFVNHLNRICEKYNG
jgi:hypothetical protein